MQQVYIAKPDGKAHLVTLALGPQIGFNWLVDSGLAEGDEVIIDNLQKIREGAPVAPHKTTITAPAAASASTAARRRSMCTTRSRASRRARRAIFTRWQVDRLSIE